MSVKLENKERSAVIGRCLSVTLESPITVYPIEAGLLATVCVPPAIAYASDTGAYYLCTLTGWVGIAGATPGTPADPLAGTSLTLSLTPAQLFDARIPSGLPADWYACGANPGDLVDSLHYEPTYTLQTADPASRFAAGPSGNTDGGNVTHVRNSSDEGVRAVSAGVGTTGEVEITDLADFGPTTKVNVTLNIVSVEGCSSHQVRHDGSVAGPNSGITLATEIYHDDSNLAPTFTVTPTATVNTAVDAFLSGIAYLGAGSTIDIAATAANAFDKAYHPTQVGVISGPTISPLTVNPASVPAFNAPFPISETITVGTGVVMNPQWTVLVQKPDGTNVSAMTAALGASICAGGAASTGTTDDFADEAQRLTAALAPWDSTTALVDGEAQVFCGEVGYPSATDYPGFALPAEYVRRIDLATANNGNIVFGGLTDVTSGSGQISPFGTGDLNVLLHLENDDIWFDLGQSAGAGGPGTTRATAFGARNDTLTTGNDLRFTFNVFSTALNNQRYEIYLIFNNAAAPVITDIVGT